MSAGRVFKLLSWAMLVAAGVAAILPLVFSVDPRIQQFVIRYGFDFCLSTLVLASFLGVLEAAWFRGQFETKRTALRLLFFSWVCVVGAVYSTVFWELAPGLLQHTMAAFGFMAFGALAAGLSLWASARSAPTKQ